MFKKFMIISLLLLTGCTENYVPVSAILPQHIKQIAITKFDPKDAPVEFTEKLQLSVQDRFVTDRRIVIVNLEEADAILKGEISRYLLSPLEFSSTKIPTKYLLWVWVDISLYDAVSNKILWTEKRMESKIQYFVKSTDAFEPTTEPEAQNLAIDKLADDIVKRTIDGWFAASGVSSRI